FLVCYILASFCCSLLFFFTAPSTTQIYTLSLHDALPISQPPSHPGADAVEPARGVRRAADGPRPPPPRRPTDSRRRRGRRRRGRSEEHTSELQSPCNLVCRLLLEKKKKKNKSNSTTQQQP